LANNLNDAQKRVTKAETKLNSAVAGTDEWVTADAAVKTAKDLVAKLAKDKVEEEEAFAVLNRDDADARITSLTSDLKDQRDLVVTMKADASYMRTTMEQF
jgi:hypothetical protein